MEWKMEKMFKKKAQKKNTSQKRIHKHEIT